MSANRWIPQFLQRSAQTSPSDPVTGNVTTPPAQPPADGQTPNSTTTKDKKAHEPLFGPSIGSVSSGPAWTIGSEKKVLTDELTPDTIAAWVEKSKDPSQPTTTLQALVNLKRPSLRLSPLAVDDASGIDQHHHGLEFEYDCDAPKCGIYVHVYLPKNHPDAPSTSSPYPLCRVLVFESVVDGGFANRLKFEDGALLELGRWENASPAQAQDSPAESTTVPAAGDAPASADLSTGETSGDPSRARRRFTHFHFRKRSQNRSVAGPALAVVDADPASHEGKKDDGDGGVKLTIRLAALDEQGCELVSPNEQVTYLHVVRFGQKSEPADGETDEDSRPWVVKVVKREATIGPHTFHLHEIYGLTSSSSHPTVPTAPPPSSHTYPPEGGPAAHSADDEDPQSECLLCLSSPREVVLLPCRHLVACKECALNMVEFGAGGQISQATETVGLAGDDIGGAAAGGAAAAGGTPTTPNARRKRKAKGWFCPVCRQPYTSMLRLTTSAPTPSELKGEGSGSEDEGGPIVIPDAAAATTTEVRSGGLLGATLRPGFLRGLSFRSGPAPANDVESQAGLGRTGA